MKAIKMLFVLLLMAGIALSVNAQSRDNYTIIVSMDGFRWDYPRLYQASNLERIAQRGVKAVMRPSYPASTFPNHYTLITGLVPDHHGIINNSFWDTTNNRAYSMGDSITRNDAEYYGGEPIWITAQKQGVKTGSVYWVGSDINIMDTHPDYYKVWSDVPRLGYAQRIDTTIEWLNKPEAERPHLITLYFDEPDAAGHHYGPLSLQTGMAVHAMDSLMGVLVKKIDNLPFADKVNLVIVADHGMTEVSQDRLIKPQDYLKPTWYDHIEGTNPTSIYVLDKAKQDSICNALANIEHIKVYRKGQLPADLNYGTNKNAGDLIVVPEIGWQFSFKHKGVPGAHGYEPSKPDMQAIFYATGPAFKKNVQGAIFDNTAIYPLLAYLLGIKPAPNDGDINQLQYILVAPLR